MESKNCKKMKNLIDKHGLGNFLDIFENSYLLLIDEIEHSEKRYLSAPEFKWLAKLLPEKKEDVRKAFLKYELAEKK